METTRSNDVLIDSAKLVEKWFNDSNAAFTEIYNKQLGLTTKFYDNLFSSMVGNNKNWNQNNTIVDSFFKNDLIKRFSFFPSGNGNAFSNPSIAAFENTFKQMMEMNRNWNSALYNQMYNSGFDWSAISKDYMNLVEKRLEASKKMLSTIENFYNKGIDFSMENNKKIIEEMNEDIKSLNKENQKFWSELLSSREVNIDDEKRTKESDFADTKKRTGMVVTR